MFPIMQRIVVVANVSVTGPKKTDDMGNFLGPETDIMGERYFM